MLEWGRGSLVLVDELEYSLGPVGRPVAIDALAWVGGAYNRLWLRTDGEQRTAGRAGEGDAEAFFGRLISPYWDALIGGRVDGRWGDESRARGFFAVGLQGLAPMRFEFAPTLYISQKGDASARLEASYQLLFTQRVVIEPKLNTLHLRLWRSTTVQDVEPIGDAASALSTAWSEREVTHLALDAARDAAAAT